MEVFKSITPIIELIDKAKSIVVLTGAGASVESGIPDFRSPKGIYSQDYVYRPEKVLSHNFFMNQPKIFYEYYKENIIHTEALPNPGHIFLAELEKTGKVKAIVTQNIDGLHQLAGSKNVLEIHGSIYSNHCVRCHEAYNINYVLNNVDPIRCLECNGLVKPDVVLYGEALDNDIVLNAVEEIVKADLLIIAGTSLTVYPAADLVKYGKKTLLMNLSKTSGDIYFDYVYYGKFGDTCREIQNKMNKIE
ncbi:MAG: NAD-dependent protein deacylase [Tenericutes bacterium]|nr:NAD-dependent protein deacylase [Mycoplasmatota bacterium]